MTYATTSATGHHAWVQTEGGVEIDRGDASIPDPVEPDAPPYDSEMARAFGESESPEWELVGTCAVQTKQGFRLFWTWRLK